MSFGTPPPAVSASNLATTQALPPSLDSFTSRSSSSFPTAAPAAPVRMSMAARTAESVPMATRPGSRNVRAALLVPLSPDSVYVNSR